MKKIDFKKLLVKLKPTRRREFKTISAKAHFDWRIMVITFFFFWLAIILGSIYMFVKTDNGDIFQVSKEENTGQPVISQKLIEETVQFFEEKKAELERTKNEGSKIVDPSL